MAQEGFKRKLTAILSADAVGYSRLMVDDEEDTVRTISSYRNVITDLVRQHSGKVIDSTGDNLLAEFASVVDAVQCAGAVQKEINSRNYGLPENKMMQFRIHALWGGIYLLQRRYDQAIAEGEKSVALGPNQASPHIMLAMYLSHTGRYKEALPLVRKAMRLDPYYPSIYLELLGHIYLSMEEYEKAVEAFKMLVVREPQRIAGHRGLAFAYIRLGRKEQARSEMAEVLRLFPEYSLEVYRKQAHSMQMDPALVESDIEALREAGLK